MLVQPAGEGRLSRAGFPLDQHWRQMAAHPLVGRQDLLQLGLERLQRLAEKEPFSRPVAAPMFTCASRLPGPSRPLEHQRQFLSLEGFYQVVRCAQAHGLHSAGDSTVCGDDDDAGARTE